MIFHLAPPWGDVCGSQWDGSTENCKNLRNSHHPQLFCVFSVLIKDGHDDVHGKLQLLNISMLHHHDPHVSMWLLAFSAKHCCAPVQSCRAAVDGCIVFMLICCGPHCSNIVQCHELRSLRRSITDTYKGRGDFWNKVIILLEKKEAEFKKIKLEFYKKIQD